MKPDVIVIGAGVVGAAIAYGLAERRLRVLVLDGGESDFRASNANFGLVWQHGKGLDMPAYQRLTRSSVDAWREFSEELGDIAGTDLHYEQNGGLAVCLSETELEQRRASLMRLHNQAGGEADWEMLDRKDLRSLMPTVPFGPEVTGASFGRRDGAANPLRLLAALRAGIVRRGGVIRGGNRVGSISRDGGAFRVMAGGERFDADRVVIAAGLGSKDIAAQVGIHVPVRPQRGQILVTERLAPFMPLPMSGLRQTREGTVMIGATQDGDELDNSTTSEGGAVLSSRAIRRVPALGDVILVRQWAGLRIMTPDAHPVYSESETQPGAFVALCHSGVTLAAMHATRLADAIAAGSLSPDFDDFHQRRFDVPQAA